MNDTNNKNGSSFVKSHRAIPNSNSKDDLAIAFRTAVRDEIGPVGLGLGLLYLVLAVCYYFFLPEGYRQTIIYLALSTALVMFLFAWRAKRSAFILNYAHLVGFIIASIVYINCLVLLLLSEEVHHSSNVILLVVGSGFLFLSTGYLLLMYAIVVYTWVAVALPYFLSEQANIWWYYSVILLSALALGLIVHTVRVSLLRRYENLRLEEQSRNRELQKALETIKNQEQMFQDLFENANDLIQILDGHGNIIYANRKWKETLGYSDAELKRLNLRDIVAKQYVSHCVSILESLTKKPENLNVETIFISKDGKEIIVEGNIDSHFEGGHFVSTRGIFRDITIRRQNEEKLREMANELNSLNQKLALAYEEARNEKDKLLSFLDREEMVMLLDSKGLILGVSEKALGAIGYTRLEILGKSVVDILEPESRPPVVSLLKNGFVGTYKSVKIKFLLTAADFKTYTMGLHRINMTKERLILVIIRENIQT